MAAFRTQHVTVNGVDTAVLVAGDGPARVFLHGAGTFMGFDWVLAWAKQARVIVPFHPNFGDSADAEGFDDIQDYVMHCAGLFDALKLGKIDLIGQSLGGWMAARFAAQYPDRVRRLVLACPYGLRVAAHPTRDIFTIRPEDLPAILAADPKVVLARLPKGKDVEFAVQRYREQSAVARMVWERPHDPRLPRWLHRLTMPTLIVWGRADRLIPSAQAKAWAGLIPGAKVKTIAGAGHLLFDESAAAVTEVAKFLDGKTPS